MELRVTGTHVHGFGYMILPHSCVKKFSCESVKFLPVGGAIEDL